jgi:hypothetical protein
MPSSHELALLHADTAGLERERAWITQNADDPFVVQTQAQIDLFAGNLASARKRTRHAANMGIESNLEESAVHMLLAQGQAEALFGESAQARETVAAVMERAASKTAKSEAAIVTALNDQGLEAQRIMDRLLRENPADTLPQRGGRALGPGCIAIVEREGRPNFSAGHLQ